MGYYHSFADVETEAQRGEVTDLKVPGLKPGVLAPKTASALNRCALVHPEDLDRYHAGRELMALE